MSPELQRIRIAEACGWTDIHRALASCEDIFPAERVFVGISKGSTVYRRLPDFLADLNAMHEAEKVLTREQAYDYAGSLGFTVACERRDKRPNGPESYWPIHATAAQRAEAFLRTLGKWEDSA